MNQEQPIRHSVSPRSRLVVVGLVGLLAAVILLAWLSFPARTPLSLKLKGGSVLWIAGVSYGTTHSVEPGRWHLNWLRRYLPPGTSLSRWLDRISPIFSFNSSPELVVWVLRRDSQGKLVFAGFAQGEIVDEHGCVFGSNGLATQSTAFGTMTHLEFLAFPRRQLTFRLRLLDSPGHVLGEFVIENPAFRGYPRWTPETVPVTRCDGAVSFTLTNLTTVGGTPGLREQPLSLRPQFAVEENGQVSDDWQVSSITLEDATGNTAWVYHEHYHGCRYEAALRMKVDFIRKPQATFPAGQVWMIPHVPVAKNGTFAPYSLTNVIRRTRLLFLGVIGRGVVKYSANFRLEVADAAGSDRTARAFERGFSGSSNIGREPTLAFVESNAGVDDRLSVRVTDQSGRDLAVEQKGGFGFILGGFMVFYTVTTPEDLESMNVSFIVQKSRHAEFVIRPPALGK